VAGVKVGGHSKLNDDRSGRGNWLNQDLHRPAHGPTVDPAFGYAASVEDYTNKYKGEQVDLALFGGEYQEGVLTAYCSIEDVPHIELNGHILVPLQNVASLHCSSRCDAPEPDWPPRGLETDGDDRDE
jgi:hypothetical protein